MYMHAHLRYCEALARFGDVEGFFRGLCQLNPIAIRELVSSATPRQANCYYSSSDAAFSDRYKAFSDYEKVNRGDVALEGGWRVYSSGAGIGVRLIMHCFLGIRQEVESLIIDPMIPRTLDGLKASLSLAGHPFEVQYRINENGCGPRSIRMNGRELTFTRETNPYRLGAVRVSMDLVISELTGEGDTLIVDVG